MRNNLTKRFLMVAMVVVMVFASTVCAMAQTIEWKSESDNRLYGTLEAEVIDSGYEFFVESGEGASAIMDDRMYQVNVGDKLNFTKIAGYQFAYVTIKNEKDVYIGELTNKGEDNWVMTDEIGSFTGYLEFKTPGIYLLSLMDSQLMENCGDYYKLVKVVGDKAPTTENKPDIDNTAPISAQNATAKPTASTVLVNGKTTEFDAYNIDGNNYFKLRDLAQAINGTEKQFEVTWDNENKAISLVSGHAYTALGGEMVKGDGAAKTTELTTSTMYKDGKEVVLTAYNIGGNNYFKLRDIGQVFNFDVTYDNNTKNIKIDTKSGYVAE